MYRPGGDLIEHLVTIYLLCDCSGSMAADTEIDLNTAIKQVLINMQQDNLAWQNTPPAISAISFSSIAEWHLAATPLDSLVWPDLPQAQGITSLGAAYQLLATQLKIAQQDPLIAPPVIILCTDGKPTDNAPNALQTLLHIPLAAHSYRCGIGIGPQAPLATLLSLTSQNRDRVVVTNAQQELEHILTQMITQGLTQALAYKEAAVCH